MSENVEKDLSGRPFIGLTMGDPAGIGPEIVLKAAADPSLAAVCRPLLIGDVEFLREQAKTLGIPVELCAYDPKGDSPDPGAIPVRDLRNIPEEGIRPGTESPQAGRAAAGCIIEAVDLWRDGVIDAIVTAPINKRSLKDGGFDFPGHTEFLADLTETREFRMSFFAGRLRVVLLSTHLPLIDAISLVKRDPLIELIRFSDREISKLLGRKISLAVAGLNPHASEHGMFGSEEAAEMQPAVEACRMIHNIDVSGPFSPDTVFLRAFKGEFDAVISCYHDQATIAVKCLSFGKGVNVTLGLPLIRTSVDHGTAFEIAGKGVADHSSLLAAAALAAELAGIRRDSSTAAEV
jgi:4-hydroxythreonine-4-phosphate dehydrogenase